MVVTKSSSTVKPAEWDTTSSPTTVYHNTEIEEVPATEDTPMMYNYKQEQYTREEYVELNRANTEKRLNAAEEAILALMDGGMI